MNRRLIFTVDLDRDVNLSIEGRVEAGSIDRGQGTEPRFSSTEKGLDLLLDILDDIGMKATFFVEGHTAQVVDCSSVSGHCIGFHGYDHEDLTKVDNLSDVMDRGYSAVKDSISAPTCFRAPYMTIDDRVYEELERLGIHHDSSVYGPPDSSPYEVGKIMEHPVAKGKDANGKTIAAYLWPMHEGKRKPSDYVHLAMCTEGDIVLCTHTWHLVESRDDGIMDEDSLRNNLNNTRETLIGIIDAGFRPAVITE